MCYNKNMQRYTITQRFFSWGVTYAVTQNNEDEVIMLAKQKILSLSPKIIGYKGENSKEIIATMEGDLFRFSFTVHDETGKNLGGITFPFFEFGKSFTLNTSLGSFRSKRKFIDPQITCYDSEEKEILSITKVLNLTDTFNVEAIDDLPKELVIMSAIALDQKYYQNNK